MNPLLIEPTVAQRRLLEVIWEPYAAEGRWPFYQHIDRKLDGEQPHAFDAKSVLAGCPSIRSNYGNGYGWIWLEGSVSFPADDSRIGLTIVGMSWLTAAAREVELFRGALWSLTGLERALEPSPFQVQDYHVSLAELGQSMVAQPREAALRRLGELCRHEPPTMAHVSQGGDDPKSWAVRLSPRIRPYREVQDARDYAERVVNVLAPPQPESAPVLASSLALPEAIDYLNAVWRLRYPDLLFRGARLKAAAELTYDCQTSEEFDSRLTALYGILCSTRIPGRVKDAKPPDLKRYLTSSRPAVAPRAHDAIGTMETFLRARAWRHHVEATDGLAAMERLGVKLPIDDWEAAWRSITLRMVAAFNALREEIEVIPIRGSRRSP